MGEAALAVALTLSPAAVTAAAHPPQKLAAFAHCVAQRESHGNPRAVGDHSSARGKYQFLKSWNHGLPFMVADRLVHFGVSKKDARLVRTGLSHLAINKWPEVLQDIAFAAVVSKPGGARHWWIAGSKCNRLGGMR